MLLSLTSFAFADTLLFEDNFTRADSGTVGNGWQDLNTKWSILDNTAYSTSFDYLTGILRRPISEINVENISMLVNTTWGGDIGQQTPLFWLRVTNTSSLATSYSGYIFFGGLNQSSANTAKVYAFGAVVNGVLGDLILINFSSDFTLRNYIFNYSAIGNNFSVQVFNGSNPTQKLGEASVLNSSFSGAGGMSFTPLGQYIPTYSRISSVSIYSVNASSPAPPPVSAITLTYPQYENIVRQRNSSTNTTNLIFTGTGDVNDNVTLTFNSIKYNLSVGSNGRYYYSLNNTPTGCYAFTVNNSINQINRSAYCVGEVIWASGQSNVLQGGTNWNYNLTGFNWSAPYNISAFASTSSSTYTYYTKYADPFNTSTWIDMSFVPLVYGLSAKYNTPVMLLVGGVGNTVITEHLNGTTINTMNRAIVGNATYGDNRLRAAMWMQGENDDFVNTTFASYYSSLQSLQNLWVTDWRFENTRLQLNTIGSYQNLAGVDPCSPSPRIKVPVIADLYAVTNNASSFILGTSLYDVATIKGSDMCVHINYVGSAPNPEAGYVYGIRTLEAFDKNIFGASYVYPSIVSVNRINTTALQVVWDQNIVMRSYNNRTTQTLYGIDLYANKINNTFVDTLVPTINSSSIVNISINGNVQTILFNTNISSANYAAYGLYSPMTYNRSVVYTSSAQYPYGVARQTLTYDITPANEYVYLANSTVSPANNSAYSPGTLHNFTVDVAYNASSSSVQSVVLFFNGTTYNASAQTSTRYNVSRLLLKAGTYNYYWNVTLSTGSKNSTTAVSYVIQKASSSLTIAFSPSANVYNNTEVTVTASGCASQIACTLFNDTTNISNPFIQAYNSTGQFNFTYNTSGNENYSAATILSSLVVSVYVPPTPTNSTAVVGITQTSDTVFYAFGIIALITIVGAGFMLVTLLSRDLDPQMIMMFVISAIGLAIVLLVGFVIIGNVETSITAIFN